jgi:hypothetical protein
MYGRERSSRAPAMTECVSDSESNRGQGDERETEALRQHFRCCLSSAAAILGHR